MSEFVEDDRIVEDEDFEIINPLNEKEKRTERFFRKVHGDKLHPKSDSFNESLKKSNHKQSADTIDWEVEADNWDDEYDDFPPNIWED